MRPDQEKDAIDTLLRGWSISSALIERLSTQDTQTKIMYLRECISSAETRIKLMETYIDLLQED